jgi:RNA polymerase sigma factor (sigma-70 family)
MGAIVQRLRALVGGRLPRDASDGDLLGRFVQMQDESAFAVLVQRHGSLVLGVCRRVLQDEHVAEDAFQATFLVLLRRAATLDRRGSLSGWLYGVASRVALRARAQAAHWRASGTGVPDVPCTADESGRELRALLDRELQGLPDKYRLPLVLCHLQSKTHEEAARELGWPRGSLAKRLARGEDLLRGRLARAGLAPSTGAIIYSLAREAKADVPVALVEATLVAAGAPGITASATVILLVEGVLKEMFRKKLLVASLLILTLGLASTGVGLFGRQLFLGQALAVPLAEKDGKTANDADSLEPAWSDLASADEAQAMRAILRLAGSPQRAVPFLKDRLLAVDSQRIPRLIVDLENQAFHVRQKATEQLEAMNDHAVEPLRHVLEGKPTLDLRKRVETILAKIDSASRRDRVQRAIALLEHIGTADAQQVLEELARGRTKEEVQASLARLRERPAITLERRYEDLASTEAGQGARAFLALVAVPKEALEFVSGKVQKQAEETRGQSLEEVGKKMGEVAKIKEKQEDQLRQQKEILQRLDAIIARLEKYDTPPVLTTRVTVFLEHWDTPTARQLLQTIRDSKMTLEVPKKKQSGVPVQK